MVKVVVVRPFSYAGKRLKTDDVVEMPEFHATIFRTGGKVRDYQPPKRRREPRREEPKREEESPSERVYLRRDMEAEGGQE